MKRVIFFSLLMAGVGLTRGAEAGADPAALTALRQHYQGLLSEAEGPARARWLAAMEAQEQQRVTVGDFEGAAVIRQRRMEVLSGKSAMGPARAPLLLTSAVARTSSAVDFLDQKKEVGRFRRTGALMEWELPGQAPGWYEVRLICGVMGGTDLNDAPDPYKDPTVPLPVRPAQELNDGTAGGVVEFRKVTSLKEGGELLRASVRSTGGWAMERTLKLGRVLLDSKISKFSLRAVDAMPAGLMDFRRLELVPMTDELAITEAAEPKELTRLREVYQKQFTDQTRSLTAKYLKGLGDLEVASARVRDNDSLALVRQEKQRMEQGDTIGSAAVGGASGARVLPVTEKLYMLVKGEAKLTSQGDYLTKMRPAAGCEITWKLAGLGVTSGTYSVTVECRLTPEHGGTATLAATTPGGAPGPALQIVVEAPDFVGGTAVGKRKPDGSPGISLVRTVEAGKVTIPKGSEYVTLRVASLLTPDGALCDLKSIRLVPVTPESP